MNVLHAVSCAALLVQASWLTAGLEFEKTRVEILARPDQNEVEAVFPFTNRGDSEAKIEEVVSNCQCLSAKSDAERLAPRESGRITGIFRVGNVPGVSEKSLQVRVSEGGRKRLVALTVAVESKELITVEPRTLAWTVGGDEAEKTFVVTMRGEEPIHLKEVVSSLPGYVTRIETVTEGAEYKVYVKPPNVSSPSLGVFRLTTDCKFKRFTHQVAFAQVKNP
jgi:hypothetical protein